MLGPKGADLIDSPMTSGGFANWGSKGKGNWITTYGDSGHVFVVIAGLRFDTSMPDDRNSGPGWSKDVSAGFANVSKNAARHKGRPLELPPKSASPAIRFKKRALPGGALSFCMTTYSGLAMASFARMEKAKRDSGPGCGLARRSRSPHCCSGASFGVLAEPVMGTVAPVVMSAIVFAGSAQFGSLAVLAAGGGAGAAIAAGVLLNMRYLPMGISIAASTHGGWFRRGLPRSP